MITATMYRQYFPTFTAGIIPFENQLIYTVERPWICDEPEEHRAGKPFESCVPEGLYEINQFNRTNGDLVWSISNPELGVFLTKTGMLYDTDRYACLIHSANYARQVVGCIGPGVGAVHNPANKDYMVTASRDAMTALGSLLSDTSYLEITSYETLKKTH